MIKLYTDDGVIVSKKEIITTTSDTERALLSLKENHRKSMDRRQFMVFSAVLAGSIVYPTKAEAWIWWLIRPAISFIVRRNTTRIITTGGRQAIQIGKNFKNQSRVKKIKEIKKLETEFKASVGLNLNPQALLSAAEIVAESQTKIIWDRDGYHYSSKRGEEFKNIAWLKIENKSNDYVETKIKLALLTGQNQVTFKRQHTLEVAPNASEEVDVSSLYRKLPENGIQYIVYELTKHQNQIKISSPNKKIYVTNLIT